MAAVLACGASAVLSHRSAAALWGLLPITTGPTEVVIPAVGGRSKRPGIRIHRSRTLTADGVTRHRCIPVTTVGRTIDDLRRTASAQLLRRAAREAAVLGFEVPTLSGAENTRSELEHRFLKLCRRHRLPLPEANVAIGPFQVDFLWRRQRLVVETDGYRFHRGRQAFEDDRARDLELRLMGYEVVRFTYRQVIEERLGVAAALRQLLRPEAR